MNLMIQAFAALAEKRIQEARTRADGFVAHAIACAAPLETLAHEARAMALAKIDSLLRESGFGSEDVASEIRDAAEARQSALEERIRALESELALTRKRAEDAEANAAPARASKPSRRKSSIAAETPRLDA